MFWGFQVFMFDSFLNPKLWTGHNNYIALGINLNKENFHCNIRGTSCCSQVMNSFWMELLNSIQIQFIPNVCVISIPSTGNLLGHVTMIFLKWRYFSTDFWNYLLWCYVFDYSTPKVHFVVEHLNYVFVLPDKWTKILTKISFFMTCIEIISRAGYDNLPVHSGCSRLKSKSWGPVIQILHFPLPPAHN